MPFIYNFDKLYGEGTVAALGNFDGVHIGHAMVLYQTRALAKELGVQPSALIFKEHPKASEKGGAPPKLLTLGQKDEAFKAYGIEDVYLYNFEDVRNLTPEEFVKEILIKKLNAKGVCCGFNYRFGKNASGDAETLEKLCGKYGLRLCVAGRINVENEAVCSTRIRAAVESGNIELANKMLGRVFSYDFTVVGGDKLGRLLGTPTINQYFPEGFVSPRFGVYASRCLINGAYRASVTNIGVRPTVDAVNLRSETFIVGFSGDLYGQNIEVGLIKFLRQEKKFDGFEALSGQIRADIKRAVKAFSDFEG